MSIDGRSISPSCTNQLTQSHTTDGKATGSIKLDNTSLAITQHKKNQFGRLLSQVNYLKRPFKSPLKFTLLQHKVKPAELSKLHRIPNEVISKMKQELQLALQLYVDQNRSQHAGLLRGYIKGLNAPDIQLGRYVELNQDDQVICKDLPNNPNILAKLLDGLLEGHSRSQQSTLYKVIHSVITNDQGLLKHYLQINWLGNIKARKAVDTDISAVKLETGNVVNLHSNKPELTEEQLKQQLTELLDKIKYKSNYTLKAAAQHDYFVIINNRLSHLFGFHQSGQLPITKMMQPQCSYSRVCQTLSTGKNFSVNTLNRWSQLEAALDQEKATVENKLVSIIDRLSIFQEDTVKQHKVASIDADVLTACQQAKLTLAKIKPSPWQKLISWLSNTPQMENSRVKHAKWRIDNVLKALLQEPARFELIKDQPYIRSLIAGELKCCLDGLKPHPTIFGKEIKFIKTAEFQAFEKLMKSLGYISPVSNHINSDEL